MSMGLNTYIDHLIDLTIKAGTTESNKVPRSIGFDAEGILICAPAALDAGTYSLLIYPSNDGSGTAVTGQDETGTDVVIPAATKGIVYSLPCWPSWSIKGPSAGADRIFKVYKMYRV